MNERALKDLKCSTRFAVKTKTLSTPRTAPADINIYIKKKCVGFTFLRSSFIMFFIYARVWLFTDFICWGVCRAVLFWMAAAVVGASGSDCYMNPLLARTLSTNRPNPPRCNAPVMIAPGPHWSYTHATVLCSIYHWVNFVSQPQEA